MSRDGAWGAALVLACSPILAACGSSREIADRPLAPPVIREQFTPLPCPRSRVARQTTIGAEGCLERRILRTDAGIDARTRAIFGLLRDRTARRRFLVAERAWLRYRRASCRSVADVYRGGTAQPVAFAQCVVDRNRQHLEDLAPFEAFLRKRP
jgi:uncharacterized protein YecT (DUF1311 family)